MALQFAAFSFTAWLGTSYGQRISFDGAPIPPTMSLSTYYSFFVFSESDAAVNNFGKPFVTFGNIEAHAKAAPAKYESLQVSFVKYSDFWNLINPDKFCSDAYDVKNGLAKSAGRLLINKTSASEATIPNVYVHTVSVGAASDAAGVQTGYISESGAYVLVVSNCGEFEAGEIHGSVQVRNPHGFLSAIEYYKMPLYFWLMCAYIFLAVIWLALTLRWWQEVLPIQNCIFGVILCGCLEGLLWYVYLKGWNVSGDASHALTIMSLIATIVKSTFSYTLVLVASLGWGVTRPFLEKPVVCKVAWLSVAHIVFESIHQLEFSYRGSHSFSNVFVALCIIPISIINSIIVYWVGTALANLIETLKERHEDDKLVIFERLSNVLYFSVAAAGLGMCIQVVDLGRSPSLRWRYQCPLSDGLPHFISLFILLAMMYLWSPNKKSQQYYEACGHELENSAGVWADDVDVDDGDNETFWATTQADSAADTVGKRDDPSSR